MKNIRTDLAMEVREMLREGSHSADELAGIEAQEETVRGMNVTRVRILDEQGEIALGKPRGSYTTVEMSGLVTRDTDLFPDAIAVVAEEIRAMLPEIHGCTLVVGLGNRSITPDAVGAQAVDHIMVTRHLIEKLPEMFAGLEPVAAISPGVLGMTGVESREVIRGVAEHIRPDCIIVVDALASRRLSRLCRTVQITDTGIVPGSGVGNSRAAINREALGVPVIAVGVPTVADIRTVFRDTAEDAGIEVSDAHLKSLTSDLMVTPKEIDVRVSDISRIIGYAINTALQPNVTVQDMDAFLV